MKSNTKVLLAQGIVLTFAGELNGRVGLSHDVKVRDEALRDPLTVGRPGELGLDVP